MANAEFIRPLVVVRPRDRSAWNHLHSTEEVFTRLRLLGYANEMGRRVEMDEKSSRGWNSGDGGNSSWMHYLHVCVCVYVCTYAGGVSLICELTSGVLQCYRKHLSPGPPLSLLADRRCLHQGPVICLLPCWVVAQSSLPFLLMAPQLTLSSLQLIRLLSQRFILNSLQSPPA